MDKLNFSQALEEIWKLRRTNKYVDETMPWVLDKEKKTERLNTVLYNLSESLRIISILIKPYMEKTSLEIRKQLGLENEAVWEDAKSWGLLPIGIEVKKGNIIFPRLDIKKELVRLDEANQKLIDERAKKKGEVEEVAENISIDDFAKCQFRVAEVIECEDHPKADKLLVLKLKIGEETRQVVSGIKKWYKAEDLVGKKVIAIVNLEPVKLRGVESQGMVLAAEDDEGNLSLLSTLEDVKSGAIVS